MPSHTATTRALRVGSGRLRIWWANLIADRRRLMVPTLAPARARSGRYPVTVAGAARYDGARARKNYAGTSPITRASGKKKVVLARYVRNKRLADALHHQAFSALSGSPGARAYYDALRDRDIGYNAA